jgi:mercuric ion transport protein
MSRVELIYDRSCPNVPHARKALLEGFVLAGLRPSWTEWDRGSSESPGYVRRYGSPTILVDGRDVAATPASAGLDSCRLYDHGVKGLKGVPPVEEIASAFAKARTSRFEADSAGGVWRFAATLPGAGAGLIPVGLCPACWPAYVGVMGSLGLGFLLDPAYLSSIVVGLLGLALFALAFRARSRRGYGPLALGSASAGLVMIFKFVYVIDPLVYAGILGLVSASVWNARPRKKSGGTGFCPKCVPAATDH